MNEINRDKRSSWSASNYSMFWSKSLEYGYKHKLGTKIPTKVQRPLAIDAQPIQDSYDFRQEPYMANNLRKDYIRDQGECGASWAFSALGLIIFKKIIP